MRRFQTHDEQLHKDVEGVIELATSTLSLYAKQRTPPHAWLTAMLELFDACCWFLKGRAKPSNWVACVLKAAKLFDGPTRGRAAADAQVTVLWLLMSCCK